MSYRVIDRKTETTYQPEDIVSVSFNGFGDLEGLVLKCKDDATRIYTKLQFEDYKKETGKDRFNVVRILLIGD